MIDLDALEADVSLWPYSSKQERAVMEVIAELRLALDVVEAARGAHQGYQGLDLLMAAVSRFDRGIAKQG